MNNKEINKKSATKNIIIISMLLIIFTLVISRYFLNTGKKGNYLIGENVNIGDSISNDTVLELLGIQREKYTGTYTGNWIVIGKENERVKLVSAEDVESYVFLGNKDISAIDKVTVANDNILADEKKLEIAIWSYNNLDETLNNIAKKNTGIPTARSITENDINELAGITTKDIIEIEKNYGKTYKYSYKDINGTEKICWKELEYGKIDTEENWSSEYSDDEYNSFISYNGKLNDKNKNNIIKLQNNFYSYDVTRKGEFATKTDKLNSLTTQNAYWVSAQKVMCSPYSSATAYFSVGMMNGRRKI